MENLRDIVSSLARWGKQLMPDPDRAERLHGDLLALGDEASDPTVPVSPELLALVEETCHRTARHLTLELHDDARPPDETAPGWPPVSRIEVARRAANVRTVRRHGGIGELRLDGFDDLRYAAPYLRSAFTILQDCEGLTLDLRSNGGGALSSLAVVAEFVLGPEPTHLATVHHHERPPRQWWTSECLGDLTLAPDVRVAVLIGPGTYSSGEALAYHLRHRGRVRTFGSRTPGAADHVTPVRITPRVTALVPEATPIDPVTGTNWEGDGVSPDVECDPESAGSIVREWLRSSRS